MKLGKKQWLNIALLIGVGLFLFTPVGFHARVFVGRLLSTSASVIKPELQMPIENYDWQLVNDKGQNFNFKSTKNKVVVINFWATWCPPCIAEMPSFQNLYDDYSDKVDFMFVAKDKAEKVSAFMIKKDYNLPVYYSKDEAPSLLTSKTIPTTYVLDKEGRIVVAETGVADWNSNKIRKLLDELIRK
ncbi:TlpA family protein disulfide reductase [Maribacter sp. HTCC2170]|uniref:TlpA family protein disulfide reductase n=1 Tax=Maribacter sp. (strain HTCC2170 / KCCM 42371) TaxID=313603 RepID=UPI00006B2150|nr:TlpA disulfide reductase family protein [Maribacter sp. HTCC2170]EAR00098.1 thioredoxin, putative [Maribacter sp. HTCC2170]